MTESKSPYPISSTVARFVDRLAGLSNDEWESIQTSIKRRGLELSTVDASRNAAVALAVRDLISMDQFDNLYQPFLLLIPLDSLEASPNLD